MTNLRVLIKLKESVEYFPDFSRRARDNRFPYVSKKTKATRAGAQSLLSGKRSGAYGVALPRISIS
jgi:hypothetical protein